MATVFCPDCSASICLDPNAMVGQRFTCLHCGAELEVIDTLPLELDWAYDEPYCVWESEDWDLERDAPTVGQGQEVGSW